MAELIENVDYREIAKIQQSRIRQLNYRLEGLKAVLIVFILFTICAVGALAWSIHDFKAKPVTVLLENQIQELDKLPLPPLEEIKGE